MTNLEKMLLDRSSQDLLDAINKAILETIPESYSNWHGWPGSVLIANQVYRAIQKELE